MNNLSTSDGTSFVNRDGGAPGAWRGNHGRQRIRKTLAEFHDPENVQLRRAEKRKLRQLRHQERVVLKSERDRIWRERQKGQGDQERRDSK